MNSKSQELFSCLVIAGFGQQTAKLITAQAAHETGNFTSKLFTDFNNPFGMNHPLLRKTFSLGAWYGYATFPNLQAAANDFLLWWKAAKMPMTFNTVNTYVDALFIRKYFTASVTEYKTAVNYFYSLYYAS
jgi:hypothetical protein